MRAIHDTAAGDNTEELGCSSIVFIIPTSIHYKWCYTVSKMAHALMMAEMRAVDSALPLFAVPLVQMD